MNAFRFLPTGLALTGLLLSGPLASAQVAAPTKSSPAKTTTTSERDAQRPPQNAGSPKMTNQGNADGSVNGNMTNGTMNGGTRTSPPTMSGAASGNAQMGGMSAPQGPGVMVGGAMMLPSRDIVDNAVLSKDHTTLVSAVKAADLVPTLKGAGPYTVFAPTNDAFDRLPAGTTSKLLMADQKPMLTKVLTYHVVAGRFKAADLQDGQTLTTVQGSTLKVMKRDGQVMLRDDAGHTATIKTPDVVSSNGVTHVIDVVLMPQM